MLARAAARRHEIGVRLSLGGSRLRIIRQLLVESLTLAMAAAAIGLGIAFVLPSFIVSRMAGATMFHFTPDFMVLAYTMLAGCSRLPDVRPGARATRDAGKYLRRLEGGRAFT